MRAWRCAFEAEGLNIERLIHQAGERGIIITGMKRLGARKISGLAVEDALPSLQEIAQRGGWQLTVGGRRGAGRMLETLRSRWLLAVCMAAAAALVLASMQLVWRVEIIDAGRYEADIRGYLEAIDVRPLRLKRSIDPAALRDSLEWRYPEIAWVECGWRGMTLRITVVEGVASGETLTYLGSGDVIAARDGVVDRVVTVAGTARVKAGDVVRKGDVLILGEERTSEGELRQVSARGKVYARVWESAQVHMSLWETESIPTGREQTVSVASLPWFDLWKAPESGFAQQDAAVSTMPLGGLFLPVSLRRERRIEVDVQRRERDLTALKAEAKQAALRLLQEKVRIGDDFLTKWVDYSIVDAEILCAEAFGELVTDIGEQKEHQRP